MNITVSIVSHGQGALLHALVVQLAALAEPALQRVIVTLNTPEPQWGSAVSRIAVPFDLQLLENEQSKGFGANHNQAFAADQRSKGGGNSYFAVLNPDARLGDNPFPALLNALSLRPKAGLAYPRQVDAKGALQDHERLLPSPIRLACRYLLGKRLELKQGQDPDWVNAAFLLLRSTAFAQIGGFDEGYHMYCEDVDLCLRLQLAGWSLQPVTEVTVEHAGQHASHRSVHHLRWHMASLRRLWRSETWRAWHERAGKR